MVHQHDIEMYKIVIFAIYKVFHWNCLRFKFGIIIGWNKLLKRIKDYICGTYVINIVRSDGNRSKSNQQVDASLTWKMKMS